MLNWADGDAGGRGRWGFARWGHQHRWFAAQYHLYCGHLNTAGLNDTTLGHHPEELRKKACFILDFLKSLGFGTNIACMAGFIPATKYGNSDPCHHSAVSAISTLEYEFKALSYQFFCRPSKNLPETTSAVKRSISESLENCGVTVTIPFYVHRTACGVGSSCYTRSKTGDLISINNSFRQSVRA